jgi:hypothetical protein
VDARLPQFLTPPAFIGTIVVVPMITRAYSHASRPNFNVNLRERSRSRKGKESGGEYGKNVRTH